MRTGCILPGNLLEGVTTEYRTARQYVEGATCHIGQSCSYLRKEGRRRGERGTVTWYSQPVAPSSPTTQAKWNALQIAPPTFGRPKKENNVYALLQICRACRLPFNAHVFIPQVLRRQIASLEGGKWATMTKGVVSVWQISLRTNNSSQHLRSDLIIHLLSLDEIISLLRDIDFVNDHVDLFPKLQTIMFNVYV